VSVFTRSRVVAAAMVGAFVVAFAVIGAVSRSSPGGAAPDATVGAAGVPYTSWYWTMIVAHDDPNVLVMGTSNGIYRSADAGKTWAATGPAKVHATSLVEAGDSMYMGGVHATANPSPIIRKGAGRAAPDGKAVIAVSTDDGKSWKELQPRGLPSATIQALAVDPDDEEALYALQNSGKLYRSTDGASSFQLVLPKLGVAPWALAITRGRRFVAGDMDSGSHVSSNGKTWLRTPFKDSQGTRMVMEYAVDPTDPARVLMTEYGIVLSTDGGMNWHRVLKTSAMLGPVAWAPSKPTVAYAVGIDRSLWRSDNGGKTWKKAS
jgi:photosystem II stability/assembly factor-like uncharacterized protein